MRKSNKNKSAYEYLQATALLVVAVIVMWCTMAYPFEVARAMRLSTKLDEAIQIAKSAAKDNDRLIAENKRLKAANKAKFDVVQYKSIADALKDSERRRFECEMKLFHSDMEMIKWKSK